MLKKKQEGPVTAYRMGRRIAGKVIYAVHAFVIGDTLVDTGARWTRDEFAEAMEVARVSLIVNTHHHEDHVGANAEISGKLGVPILAHPSALPRLESPALLRLRFYQRTVWGWPAPSSGKPLSDEISSGSSTLKIIHTPGHCPDHICLHDPQNGLIFTGDLFCGRRFKYLRMEENYNEILDSLIKLSALDFDVICCSLFGVVKDGKKALNEKIDFMEELKAKVLELNRKGTPRDGIAKKLLGAEGSMKLITGGHYSLRNTVDSIISGKAKTEYAQA